MQDPKRRLLTDPSVSPTHSTQGSTPSPPRHTPKAVGLLSDEEQKMLYLARQYALEIERHARQESGQGQLSPTDLALMSRLVMFLRYDIAHVVTGDPEALADQDPKDHW